MSQDCPSLLRQGTMFQSMSKKDLRSLCDHMTRRHLARSEQTARARFLFSKKTLTLASISAGGRLKEAGI